MKKPALRASLFIGLLVFATTFLAYCLHLPKSGWFNWDAAHYLRILQAGYIHSPEWSAQNVNAPSTVGFFPGYPLFALPWKYLFGDEEALLIASALSLLAFSYFYARNFQELQTPWKPAHLSKPWLPASLLILPLLHPGYFYLCLPYSEGTFLALAGAAIFWANRQQTVPCAIALFLMSLTRFYGFLFAPIILGLLAHRISRAHRVGAALFAMSALPALLLYFQFKTGHWDIYFYVQDTNPYWGPKGSKLHLLNGKFYTDVYATLSGWRVLSGAQQVSVACALIFVFLTTWAVAHLFKSWARLSDERRRRSACFLLCAAVTIAVPMIGNAPRQWEASSRYSYATYYFLLLFLFNARPWSFGSLQRTWQSFAKNPAKVAFFATFLIGYFYSFDLMLRNYFQYLDSR